MSKRLAKPVKSTAALATGYAAKAVEHGWSRNVLALQIESELHKRQGRAVTNFKATLPPAQSDLAQGITKDPYLFDFLTMRDDANERAVEQDLLAHVETFLLELGAGFALVGRQVHLEVGDQDFYLDLLFYHLKWRCYVVIDLKARDFTPEAAGKMNDGAARHAAGYRTGLEGSAVASSAGSAPGGLPVPNPVSD